MADMCDGVSIYGRGIVCCSVCVSNKMSRAAVEAAVNMKNPTGLDHGWKISADPTFRNGEPNPSPCALSPDTHLHYLLNC